MVAVLDEARVVIEDLTGKLITCLLHYEGRPMVINKTCIFYTYDVISEIGLGKPAGFLTGQCGEVGFRILAAIHEALDGFAYLFHVPWVIKSTTPFVTRFGFMKNWTVWTDKQSEDRLVVRSLDSRTELTMWLTGVQKKNPKPDFFGYLYANTGNTKEDWKLFLSDMRLFVSAGT